MSNRPILILTNCTQRKRSRVPEDLHARALPTSTYTAVSEAWIRRVRAAPVTHKAKDLYCGRAVTETAKVAQALAAEVAFVSAGLGIVRWEDSVPAYNLTSSGRLADSIGQRLTEPYSPARWWSALSHARGGRGLSALVRSLNPRLILAALPASYLELVGDELEVLPEAFQRSLRILGPRRASEVPIGLQRYWLPYDGRLDCPKSGFNGTAGDFPHRALRHFSQHLAEAGLGGSLTAHREWVESALSAWRPYVRTQGTTVSDEAVLKVIAGLWEKCEGRRTRVLRELRDNSGIACEQSRFRRLADRFEESRQ